jgi:hypothetical protein
MAATSDQITAAFNAVGIDETKIGPFIAGLASLTAGLHAAGLDGPGALEAAGTMVQREIATAKIAAERQTLQDQITASQAAQQALQAQINSLNAQLGK